MRSVTVANKSRATQADVKRAVASTQRGKKASGVEQRAILRKVEALEAANPTTEPAKSRLLYGRW